MKDLKSFILLPLFTLIISPLIGQNAQTDKKLILQERAGSNQAIKARNIEKIAKFWIEDVVILTANGTLLDGKETVTTFLQNVFKQIPDVYYIRTPRKIKIHQNGKLAWEEGIWKSQRSGGSKEEEIGGRYSAIWVKLEGKWKMRSQHFGVL